MHSERWMRATSILVDLRHTYLHSDALRVLWISWVFHDRAIFGGVCRLMATEGVDHPELEEGSEDDDDLDHEKANELLIPAAVIGKLLLLRQAQVR